MADLAVALAKVGTAVFTGSSAVAAQASESLADTANDVFLLIAQRRSSRPVDEEHPLGYGREAYFWALLAAIGVLVAAAAFSLRQGIEELAHPSASKGFAVAYVVLGISAVFDLVSFRQSGGQMGLRARRFDRGLLEESRVTSDPSLRTVFTAGLVSVTGDVIALAALALNQITGSSIPQAVAAVLIARCSSGSAFGSSSAATTSWSAPGQGLPRRRGVATLVASPSRSGQPRWKEHGPFSSAAPA